MSIDKKKYRNAVDSAKASKSRARNKLKSAVKRGLKKIASVATAPVRAAKISGDIISARSKKGPLERKNKENKKRGERNIDIEAARKKVKFRAKIKKSTTFEKVVKSKFVKKLNDRYLASQKKKKKK